MKRRLGFESLVYLLALGAGLPGAGVAVYLLWTGNAPDQIRWLVSFVVIACWLGFTAALREKVVFPLRTFSNLLAALREGDFSFRMRADNPSDALGEVMVQVNAMAETLREQRLSAMEATALLRKVMAEIDVAIFAFDSERHLRLINRAGERLLAKTAERIMNLTVEELGLSEYLDQQDSTVVRAAFPGATGLWGTRRTEFREGGLPHVLLVITDLTRPLREEELAAWQRLVRVLGHEINNSLAPVKSISRSLADLLENDPLPLDWKADARSGLLAIEKRSEALSRFTGSYARLARLPSPEFRPLQVADWIARVVRLETRLAAEVHPGPDTVIQGDADQLEQTLINLLRNAVDAALDHGGGVRVYWSVNSGFLEVVIEDDGPGLASSANLFVPFFTTKPHGSGIGLVLSRQIAEAHNGELTLTNREDATGCAARLRLPVWNEVAEEGGSRK